MQLATVFKTFSPAEAQLLRSRLEAAGFSAHVTHELSALSMEGYAMAAGGILVQVPEERAAEARALIDSFGEPDE
ncbi:MAG: DUF2007 domain-containing protein [Verrucomicrobia bacterium]|nr:DUF2007 domain-containing protein [Verrucomicrobiota bacterium]